VCPNCGHAIDLNFCPNCGQHAAAHNTSVWAFIAEFFEEFISLDSKFLRTMIPLVTKPGFLTREWAAGKRARYITPLKLYISLSAIFFLIFANTVSIKGENLITINKGSSRLPAWMNNLATQLQNKDTNSIRDHFLSHVPTAALLLVPVTALVFSVLYVRRQRYYLEHLVFLFHFNAFSFLVLGISRIADLELLSSIETYWRAVVFISICVFQMLSLKRDERPVWRKVIAKITLLGFTFLFLFPIETPASVIAFFWICAYLILAMRRNYEQGWVKTTLKFGLFGYMYLILFVVAIGATAFTSALLATSKTTATPDSKAPAKHSH